MVTVGSKQSAPTCAVPTFDAWLDDLARAANGLDTQRLQTAFHQAQKVYADAAGDTAEYGFAKVQAVATMLAELGLDSDAVIAGLLYELPQLRKQDARSLATTYGTTVADLVLGASRVVSIGSVEQVQHSDDSAQAEALRKTVLAMARDIRVMFIALVERIVTLRALDRLPRAWHRPLALQTLQLHGSLANRLGVSRLKWELEDLSLRALEPDVYHDIASKLAVRRQEREATIRGLRQQLSEALSQAGIEARVDGRPKHIYSIWQKMRKKHLYFDELFDLRALRVRVDTVRSCYEALSIAHTLWPNNAAEYDDYIAAPKANNYQSLHTVVTPPDGKSLEIQFRTHQMHEQAELGVAAHWRYKEGGRRDATFDSRVAWLRELLEWARDDAGGYGAMQDAGTAVFDDHVFVFTPQGDILDLPSGSTPLDFAYRVHTQVGHRCRGARVNGRIVPLTHQLEIGDRVEVLTAAVAKPSRDWANPTRGYLASKRARARVQQWFRAVDVERDVAAGRLIMERAWRRVGGNPPSHKALAQMLRFPDAKALLAALGRGEMTEARVTTALQGPRVDDATQEPEVELAPKPRKSDTAQSGAVVVGGVDNLLTRLAACCHPGTDDVIVAYITRRNGIAIHRHDCPNVTGLEGEARERVIAARWGSDAEATA